MVSEEVVQLCDKSLHRWDELDESLGDEYRTKILTILSALRYYLSD